MSPDAVTHEPERLSVDLGERSYDIVIGEDLIARAGELIRPHLRGSHALIVTDENVAECALAPLKQSLDAQGIAHQAVTLPPGEETKSFAQFERLQETLLGFGIDRKAAVIALGGGVIGDLAGFAAASLLRGVDFIQIPTSLLAQVDSSVGGKTGINSKHGKNLIGAFYQPRLVLADTGILDSLPPRELRAGYAEVVKYGLIDQPDFFEWLEENGAGVLAGEPTARRHAIRTSCAAKARVVAADEREGGVRALLNLGHTFGHALERETGYGDTLLHGEAVAIGMVMAFDFSMRQGLCHADDYYRVKRHLAGLGLPVDLTDIADESWSADRLLSHMAKDKKAEAGRLTFILARGIGETFIEKDVDPGAVKRVLADYLAC